MTAPRSRLAWRTHEIAYLVREWNAGTSASAIAQHLGRSTRAVYDCARVTPGTKSRKILPWTPAQRRMVDQALDLMVDQLAVRLGRTPRAVLNQVRRSWGQCAHRKRARKIVDIGGMSGNVGRGERVA